MTVEGIVVVPESIDSSYSGFDGYDRWPGLEDWNLADEENGILLSNGLCHIVDYPRVLKYYLYLKLHSELKVKMVFISTDPSISENDVPKGFVFIGFDCGFVMERDDLILYSVINNEFEEIDRAAHGIYKDELNSYRLFKTYNSANKFAELREKLKGNRSFNLECAFDLAEVEVVKVYNYVLYKM